VLAAPLAANVNHKGTAFAGSLNALATLAGWSTIWLLTRAHGVEAHVVIQDSSVKYLRPVSGDFEAVCAAPTAAEAAALLTAVQRRGRGRIALQVAVTQAGAEVVRFTGRYVVLAHGAAA